MSTEPTPTVEPGKLYSLSAGPHVAIALDFKNTKASAYFRVLHEEDVFLAVEEKLFPTDDSMHYRLKDEFRHHFGFIFLTENGRIWIDRGDYKRLIPR